MKRITALFLAFLTVVLLLTACGAGSDNVAAEGNFGSNSAVSGEGSTLLADRKLIRSITLDVETEDMDSLLTQVNERVSALGGYVESRSIQNGSSYRWATLVLRIPAENLDSLVEHISGQSNILSMTEDTEDVTLEYVDTESQLKTLRAEEERLLEFLGQAENVSEMLEIEQMLTQVRTQIESLTAQLNAYDNLVDYGTVTLYIDEVQQYTDQSGESLLKRMGTGFLNGLKALGLVTEGLLVVFSTVLPFLLIPAIVAVAIILIVRAKRKKKK